MILVRNPAVAIRSISVTRATCNEQTPKKTGMGQNEQGGTGVGRIGPAIDRNGEYRCGWQCGNRENVGFRVKICSCFR